jgi:hypothetical protein
METRDHGTGKDEVSMIGAPSIFERGIETAQWIIERWASEEDKKNDVKYSKEECLKLFGIDEQVSVINAEMIPGHGNILVNAGINAMWTLIAGTGATKFDNTNAYLGVGDSNTAAAAGQTDLQAASNKLRVAMNGGYPTYGTSQVAVWQSDFTSAQANYAWEEFAVFNASSGGTMLNRKTSAQGTKTSGQTWRLTLTITLS